MDHPFHRHPAEISFRDTDASGWMHFTSAFLHLEAAEHACLRQHGLLVFAREQGGWPRAHLNCDYHRPLLGGDKIEVQLVIAALGTSSVTWQFEILTVTGQTAVSGSLVTVRVDHCGKPQALSPAERTALERGLRHPDLSRQTEGRP